MEDMITDELKNLMKTMTKQTEEDKKIRAILLCRNESYNIVPSNVSVGDESGLSADAIKKMKCPKGTTEIGMYRSNPPGETKKDRK